MRERGELPEPEEQLLGIERPTPEQEAEAEKIAQEKLVVRALFLKQLMEQELFREWLMDTLNGFGTFENAFGTSITGFPDPMATQFKLGMKAAGWHLWTLVDDAAPELASLMRRTAGKPVNGR
jgi:hypothetical protein